MLFSGSNGGFTADLSERRRSVGIHHLQVSASHGVHGTSRCLITELDPVCSNPLSPSVLCPLSSVLSVPQLFDAEGRGSLSAEELSDLMGALLGFPQHHTAELHAQASCEGRLTEGESGGFYFEPPLDLSINLGHKIIIS